MFGFFTDTWVVANSLGPMVRQEGNGNLTYLNDAHMGYIPKEITMGI